jgi:hypothetical protein
LGVVGASLIAIAIALSMSDAGGGVVWALAGAGCLVVWSVAIALGGRFR